MGLSCASGISSHRCRPEPAAATTTATVAAATAGAVTTATTVGRIGIRWDVVWIMNVP